MPTSIPLTSLAIIVAATVFGSACTTMDAYSGEEKTSSATKGALIGAFGGVVVGALSGKDSRDRKKRMLLGAGIGGVAGAGVGAYMDKQEAELRQQLQGSGVSVTRSGDNITLNMPSNITFRSGSADLDPNFFRVLDSVGLVLKKYDQTLVEVVGHTDSVGSEQSNKILSQNRANTVTRYLVSRGLLEERTLVLGGGEQYPVASNDNEAGRAMNRRVELSLLPIRKD